MKTLHTFYAVVLAQIIFAIQVAFAADYVHPDAATGVEPSASPTTIDVIRFAIVRDGPGIFVKGVGSGGNIGNIGRQLTALTTGDGSLGGGGVGGGGPLNPPGGPKDPEGPKSFGGRTSGCTHAGSMGLLYLKQSGNITTPTEALKTCIAPGPDPAWSSCIQGTVYTRQSTDTDPKILGADFAVGLNGRAAVAWTELSGTTTATVQYKIAFTTDNGATWATPLVIGQYDSTGGYAVPNDIDVAVNNNNEFGALVFFDRDDGTNTQLLGSATTDWLSLVVYNADSGAVTESMSVVAGTDSPLHPKNARQAASIADLTGSTGSVFHAFYAQDNAYKVFTRPLAGSSYVRTVSTLDINNETDPQGIFGNYPIATRSAAGATVRTSSGLFDVPDANAPATKRGNHFDPFWVASNQFTYLTASLTFVVDVVRNVDAYYIDGTGTIQGPYYNINDRVMSGGNFMPRCVDETSWTRSEFTDPDPGAPAAGSQCYQFYNETPYEDLEYHIGENPGAMVGSTLYLANIRQTREWNGTDARFWDKAGGQQIVISSYAMPFAITCVTSGGAPTTQGK